MQGANFLELRKTEVGFPRIPLPRRWVNIRAWRIAACSQYRKLVGISYVTRGLQAGSKVGVDRAS